MISQTQHIVDLENLEKFAALYFDALGGCDDNSKLNALILNRGYEGFVKAFQADQCEALFQQALSSAKPHLAALCLDHSLLYKAIRQTPPSNALGTDDWPGLLLRKICSSLTSSNIHPKALDLLAKKAVEADFSNKLNPLSKNALNELSASIACEVFNESTAPSTAQFLKLMHDHASSKDDIDFNEHLKFAHQELFYFILTSDLRNDLNQCFVYISKLDNANNRLFEKIVGGFGQAIEKLHSDYYCSNSAKNIISIMLSDSEVFQPFTKKIISVVNNDQINSPGVLCAASIVFHKTTHQRLAEFDAKNIARVFTDCGYAHLNKLIQTRSDYQGLSEIPGIDMTKIELNKIPLSARGAALESALGV
jgi:hypothetical protein